MGNLKKLSCAFAIFALGALADSPAALAWATEPAITQHEIQIAGRPLKYTAEVGYMPVGGTGETNPHAYMSYSSYRVATPAGVEPRPVMFLWGGGPGGSSWYFNFEFAGPMRPNGPLYGAEGLGLTENEDTLLTHVDLVFPDQPATGFGYLTDDKYGPEFFGLVADTKVFADFIERWLEDHNAKDAPIYVGGMSFGGSRAGTVAYELLKRGLKLHGAALMNGGMGITREKYVSPEMLRALDLVDISSGAFYHGKLSSELGATRADVHRVVMVWARNVYAPALQRFDQLTSIERKEIARNLARFTGLPVDQIDQSTLVVTPAQFAKTLLQNEGKTLYTSDVRLTTSIPFGYEPAMLKYISDELKFKTDVDYVLVNPDIGKTWNWATIEIPAAERERIEAEARANRRPAVIGPPLPAIAEAAAINPNIKVFIATGRYDNGSSCASHAETVRSLPANLKSVFIRKCYDAGHSVFRSPSERVAVLRDIKDMIAFAHAANTWPAPAQPSGE